MHPAMTAAVRKLPKTVNRRADAFAYQARCAGPFEAHVGPRFLQIRDSPACVGDDHSRQRA
jgi:hypothetical protein